MSGTAVRFQRPGWAEPVVIVFSETADPFAILERCRQEVFPGVAVVCDVAQPKRKAKR